tara:strand:- start:2583 stop:2753 length:171 start_codon:yes stop_codon:yes gene_type:complete
MFRFMRTASPPVRVLITIIIAFAFFAFLAFAALLLLASDDCGGESYKNEYGKCDYD